MIETLFSQDALSSPAAFALSLLIGVAFGFVLEQAGFGSSRRLAGIFYFRDMAVAGVLHLLHSLIQCKRKQLFRVGPHDNLFAKIRITVTVNISNRHISNVRGYSIEPFALGSHSRGCNIN